MKTPSPVCAPHECLRRDWMYTLIVCVNVRGRAGAGRRQQRHTLVSSNRPKKKKHAHTSKRLNGTLSDTPYISITLWLKLRWHYHPVPNAQKRISGLIFVSEDLPKPICQPSLRAAKRHKEWRLASFSFLSPLPLDGCHLCDCLVHANLISLRFTYTAEAHIMCGE